MCKHCHISAWTVKHHISYFPEETIKLCFDCHHVIHKSKLPMYDKYKKYNKVNRKPPTQTFPFRSGLQ